MAELVFPLVATLGLILVAIPLTSLICKLVLVVYSPPNTAAGIRERGSSTRYLLLMAPTVAPAVVLVSAILHHAEAERAAMTCLFDHFADPWCAEPVTILASIAALVGGALVWKRRVATRAVVGLADADDEDATERLAAAITNAPRLSAPRGRTRLVHGDEIRTVGLIRPTIEVGVQLAKMLSVDELAAALLHEHEHARGYDPLRFVIAAACKALNPASALLESEWVQWRRGREAVCDEAAVHRGANPYSLAQALVLAARPKGEVATTGAHLGRGGGIELLRVRISLLMGYAKRTPPCRCARTATKIAVLAVAVLAILPHYLGDDLIGEVHQATERIALEMLSDGEQTD